MGLKISLSTVTLKNEEERGRVTIDIIKFILFKQSLMSFVSGGKFDNLFVGLYDDNEKITWHYYKNDSYVVCECENNFTKKELKNENVQKYLRRLKHMKLYYPKMRKIYPFLVHVDWGGELTFVQCKRLLVVLREYWKENKEYAFVYEIIEMLSKLVHRGKGKLKIL